MKQKTGVFAVLTAALFLGSMAGVGCGDDDTQTGGGGTGGSGGSAGTGGTAGKGGTGGSTGGTGGTAGAGTDAGGKAGSAGTAGTDAGGDGPGPRVCGTSTCNPITTAMFGVLEPCCPMGESPNACGGTLAAAGGVCLTSTPGTSDPVCPMVTVGTFPLPGCCRAGARTCGVDLAAISLGCNDPSVLGGAPGGPCGGDSGMPPPPDGGGMDTGGGGDTGPADTGPTDTGPGGDTGPADTGPGDTGPADTGPADTGTGGDTGTGDTGTGDATAG